jgi:prophage antirepressor-like protein
MKSQKTEAKQFKHWVTSEVLPSIRKTGTYSKNPADSEISDVTSTYY